MYVVYCQIDQRSIQFPIFSPSSKWHAAFQILGKVSIQRVVGHLCVEYAWPDGIDRHMIGRQFRSQRSGEVHHAAFGGIIGNLGSAACVAAYGCRIDNLSIIDQRIIDIALDCGFKSPEAFSRAFKTAFGCSPAGYRKAGLDLVTSAKKKLEPEDVAHIANNISHSPEILIAEEQKIAGIRGTVSLFDNEIPELWEEYLRFHKKDLKTAGAGYSICETKQTTYTKDGNISFSVIIGSQVDRTG